MEVFWTVAKQNRAQGNVATLKNRRGEGVITLETCFNVSLNTPQKTQLLWCELYDMKDKKTKKRLGLEIVWAIAK